MKTSMPISSEGHPSGAFLPILKLAISLLSVLCSCSGGIDYYPPSEKVETKLELMQDAVIRPTRAWSWSLVTRVDAFVFDDTPLAPLDSYCRSSDEAGIVLRSGSGPKKVAVVVNFPFSDSQVRRISSFSDLRSVVCDYCSDDPSTPVMSGLGYYEAGTDDVCRIVLSPVMSVVTVTDLRVSAEIPRLSELKVFLTGLSARAEIFRDEGFLPSEILNTEALREEDMAKMKNRSMAYKYLGNGTRNGKWTEYGSVSLYCYPNESEEESVGSPFTALRIEGLDDAGKRHIYSLPVNRRGFGYMSGREGVSRNCCYSFKIDITSPDS